MRLHPHRVRFCLISLWAVILTPLLAWGFSPATAAAQEDNGFEPSGHGIRIVLVPEKNAFVLRSQFKPVVDFIAQKFGKTMYLEVAPDYQTAVQALVDHEAEIGFLGSSTYLLARKKGGVEPLVRPVWPERKNICRSYIFVRKEDGRNASRSCGQEVPLRLHLRLLPL